MSILTKWKMLNNQTIAKIEENRAHAGWRKHNSSNPQEINQEKLSPNPTILNEVKNTMNSFSEMKTLLNIVRGVPHTKISLRIEICIFRNYVLEYYRECVNKVYHKGRKCALLETFIDSFLGRINCNNDDDNGIFSAPNESESLPISILNYLILEEKTGSKPQIYFHEVILIHIIEILDILALLYLKEGKKNEDMNQLMGTVTKYMNLIIHKLKKKPNNSFYSCCSRDVKKTIEMTNLIKMWISMNRGDIIKSLEYSKLLRDQAEPNSFLLYATHIEGLLLIMENEPISCLRLLESIELDKLKPDMRAKFTNLIGCCFALQNKSHMAIQSFKRVFEDNLTNIHLPLYNISLQYRKLGIVDAELETLHLLLQTLEVEEDIEEEHVLEDSLLFKHHHYNFVAISKLSMLDALYIYAKRCIEMQRFETGAQNYLKLLSELYEDSYKEDGIALPAIRIIHLQAADALMRAGHHRHCVLVLDRLSRTMEIGLSGHSSNLSPSLLDRLCDLTDLNESFEEDLEDDPMNFSGLTFPQIHNFSPDYTEDVTASQKLCDFCLDCWALLVRAQVSFECMEYHSVSNILDIVTNKLGFEQMSEKNLESKGDRANSINDDFMMFGAVAYNNKALICIINDNFEEAMIHLLTSTNFVPDFPEAIYNHTLLLCKLNRKEEAIENWIKYRQKHPSNIHQFTNPLLEQRMKDLDILAMAFSPK